MKNDKFNFVTAIIIIAASMIGYFMKYIPPDFYTVSENIYTEAPTETKENEANEETAQGNEPVNINSASEIELQSLDGIGEKKAKRIIDYREKNGSFKSIDEIKKVSGIGNKIFETIKDRITVE